MKEGGFEVVPDEELLLVEIWRVRRIGAAIKLV